MKENKLLAAEKKTDHRFVHEDPVNNACSFPFTSYLSLGTNIGNRDQNLQKAIQMISGNMGRIVSQSSVYITEPWGFESDNYFYNQVIQIKTGLSPLELLSVSQKIENEMGRKQKSAQLIYQDRIIDIDLLLYENLILETEELTLPHPLFHLRKFIMEPLYEIAPDLIHPKLSVPMHALLKSLIDLNKQG